MIRPVSALAVLCHQRIHTFCRSNSHALGPDTACAADAVPDTLPKLSVLGHDEPRAIRPRSRAYGNDVTPPEVPLHRMTGGVIGRRFRCQRVRSWAAST